ncbi:hypothetical protein [Thiohalocapsa halophila]|nr:hypothetical protein [Thiohalocapsa halophila]
MSDRHGVQLRGRRKTVLAAAMFLAALAAGCTGLERNPSGAITVTVKPGDTGQCAIAPCRILLEMPPGDGEYRVTGNQITLGTYPAGRTINLGNFYEPQAIEIVGADVPRAFVYLPITP